MENTLAQILNELIRLSAENTQLKQLLEESTASGRDNPNSP